MTINLLIVLFLYTLVFALAELLYRQGAEANLTRKITHIGGAVISALLPFWISLPVVIGLGLFFYSF